MLEEKSGSCETKVQECKDKKKRGGGWNILSQLETLLYASQITRWSKSWHFVETWFYLNQQFRIKLDDLVNYSSTFDCHLQQQCVRLVQNVWPWLAFLSQEWLLRFIGFHSIAMVVSYDTENMPLLRKNMSLLWNKVEIFWIFLDYCHSTNQTILSVKSTFAFLKCYSMWWLDLSKLAASPTLQLLQSKKFCTMWPNSITTQTLEELWCSVLNHFNFKTCSGRTKSVNKSLTSANRGDEWGAERHWLSPIASYSKECVRHLHQVTEIATALPKCRATGTNP